MKVLLVSHDFLPKHPAGTEIYTFEIGRALQERGHEVHVFSTEKDISLPNLEVRQRTYEGLPVHELTNNLFYNNFVETWDYPPAARSFKGLLDDLQPDIVHFMHLMYLSVGCVEEVAARNIPVMYTLHDYWLQCARYGQRRHPNGDICHEIDFDTCGGCLLDLKYRQTRTERAMAKGIARLRSASGINLGDTARKIGDKLKGRSGDAAPPEIDRKGPEAAEMAKLVARRDRELRERLLPVVHRFMAPSRFLRERLLEWGIPPEQIEFVRAGINIEPFKDVKRSPRGSKLRVAFIGTPVPHKGVHILMEAWNRIQAPLRRQGELRIYGNLSHNPGYIVKLQRLADQTGAQLCGGLKRDEVSGTLAETDVLVVPSIWYENSPLIILEALATRTPILVSDLGGMAELVEPGLTGYHFRVGDAEHLADQLSRFLISREELDCLFPSDLEVKSVKDDAVEFEVIYAEALETARKKSQAKVN